MTNTSHRRNTPFVGRTSEIEALESTLEAAAAEDASFEAAGMLEGNGW